MTDNSQHSPPELPKIFSPEDVAKHLGWSPRKVREKARQIGACHVLGNRMIMTAADVEKLLDATKPAPAPRKEIPVAVQRSVLFGSGRTIDASLDFSLGNPRLPKKAAKVRAPDDKRPFTPKTLSQRWLCSEHHVRNLIKRGDLPAQKLGGKLLRIMFDDVDSFERRGGTVHGEKE